MTWSEQPQPYCFWPEAGHKIWLLTVDQGLCLSFHCRHGEDPSQMAALGQSRWRHLHPVNTQFIQSIKSSILQFKELLGWQWWDILCSKQEYKEPETKVYWDWDGKQTLLRKWPMHMTKSMWKPACLLWIISYKIRSIAEPWMDAHTDPS
jgi:hypothetical protein